MADSFWLSDAQMARIAILCSEDEAEILAMIAASAVPEIQVVRSGSHFFSRGS